MKTLNSKCGSSVELIQLNEKLCKTYLDSVPDFQRDIKTGNKAKIDNAIENNKWMFNGQSIIFDKDGRLIDGQHRIQRFLNNKFYPEVLKVNVNSNSFDVFSTIDCGSARSLSDTFKSNKIPNYAIASTITSMAYNYEKGKNIKGGALNYIEAINFYKNNEDLIRRSMSVSNKMKTLSRQSCIGICVYVLEKNGYDVEKYINQLSSVIDLSDAQAKYHKLLVNNSNKSRGKMGNEDHIKAFLYFFKAHTQGLNIKGNSGLTQFMLNKTVSEAFKIALNTKNENKSK